MRFSFLSASLKVLLAFAAFVWAAGASAEPKPSSDTSSAGTPGVPEISAYLSAPGLHRDFQMRSGGHDQYVLPADLAKLIETHKMTEMLARLARQVDTVGPERLNRVRDLAVVILSRVKPVNDGWMTEEQKRDGSKVFRIPFATDRKLREGLPKGNAGAEWVAYAKWIEENSMR